MRLVDLRGGYGGVLMAWSGIIDFRSSCREALIDWSAIDSWGPSGDDLVNRSVATRRGKI